MISCCWLSGERWDKSGVRGVGVHLRVNGNTSSVVVVLYFRRSKNGGRRKLLRRCFVYEAGELSQRGWVWEKAHLHTSATCTKFTGHCCYWNESMVHSKRHSAESSRKQLWPLPQLGMGTGRRCFELWIVLEGCCCLLSMFSACASEDPGWRYMRRMWMIHLDNSLDDAFGWCRLRGCHDAIALYSLLFNIQPTLWSPYHQFSLVECNRETYTVICMGMFNLKTRDQHSNTTRCECTDTHT